MRYCLYLRKSRADAEAEARGEGETLARHEKILLELAKKMKLNITEIYREVVSGETIAARPVMQHLLQEVEKGIWDGVLVVEIERLARGDTIDQGIMAQTFKYSNTKIITPLKIYDPNNEFDEEYFEFGLFMSRREYKTINRRLQSGRLASVKEGKYVANKAPYGYNRVRLEHDKGWTLEIVEDKAEIIKLIYELYTTGEQQMDGSYKRLGVSLIVRKLNNMKVPTKTGGSWSVGTIRDILINPTYTGKLRWNWRPAEKKMVEGQVTITRPRSNEYTIVDGLHPAIISDETFQLAQKFMTENPPVPVSNRNTVKNPLAGIVKCGKCGRNMVRRPYNNRNQADTLMCHATSCNNVSSNLRIVEDRILNALEEWLEKYILQWNLDSNEPKSDMQITVNNKALKKLDEELLTLNNQLEKSYDLLEQGVYDTDIFLERSKSLSLRIEQIKNDITAVKENLSIELAREKGKKKIVPTVSNLLEVYKELPTAKAKNDLLKEVLEKVVYVKESGTRWHGSPDDFELTLYPKIPSYDRIDE